VVDEPVRVVAAACDGACSGNPGPGGWGALLRFEDGSVRELGGADPATTNNRMELTAALALMRALHALPRHPALVIRKGWRTASGGPVLNRDLWEELDACRVPNVRFQHVKGHSGDRDNDRCDAIAVAYSRGQPAQLADGQPSEGQAADPAPPALVQLLSRLELADRLASGGHGLSLVELAQLLEMPLRTLEQRREAFPWRDWLVQPLADGRWRLQRETPGLAHRE
jgi:ribonuclease HI